MTGLLAPGYARTLGRRVCESADGGATWTAAGPGLSAGNVTSLLIDPRDSSTMYAGTTSGLFAITLQPSVAALRPK